MSKFSILSKALSYSKLGATTARIRFSFSQRRCNDFPGYYFQAGHMPTLADRDSRRAKTAFAFRQHKLFDYTVFQGVITYDYQPTSVVKAVHSLFQRC